MAHTVLAISLSSTVHSYPFSPIQLYYNPYRREQASLKLLLGPTSQTNLTAAFHRGVKGDFSNHKWFLNNQIRLKWCYETLHNLQMRIICKSGRTQAEIYSEMDFFFFFTVYTGLKNLCISHSLTMYPYLPLTGKAELPQTSGLHAEHMLTQNPWKNCDSCPETIFLKFTVLRTATISTLTSSPQEGKELRDWIHAQQTVTQRVDLCLDKTTFLYYCY